MSKFKAGDRVLAVGCKQLHHGNVGKCGTVYLSENGLGVCVRFDTGRSAYGRYEDFELLPPAVNTGVVSGATVRSLEVRPEDLQGEIVCVPDERASDAVFRPSHYARWNIEPITFISANNLDFLTGNVIKYVMRHDAKNGLEDLRKAARYLEILIGHVEREKAGEQIKVQAV